jgi:P-type conjugative transfer protein TrbL
MAMLLLYLAMPWVMAQSAPDPANIVSSFLSEYRQVQWPDTILKTTEYLFWSLVTISAVWTFGTLLLRGVDIGEVLGELLRFVVVTGLFYWLLIQAGGENGFVNTIVVSMRRLGGDLVGSNSLQEPANAVANIGLSVFNTVVDQSVNWKDTDTLVGFALATLIVVVLALVAAQVALMLVGAWMLAYGGIFLLGFGGARWTSGIAISYYKHVLAVALSVLALILLLSIGRDFLGALHAQMRGAANFRALAVMLVLAIMLLVLCVKVPGMLFNVVTGAQLGALTATASMAGQAIVVGGGAAWSSVRHMTESSTRSLSKAERETLPVDAVAACRKASGAFAETQSDSVYTPLDYHQYGVGGAVPTQTHGGSVFQSANQPPGGHVYTRDVGAQLKGGMSVAGLQGMTQVNTTAAGATPTAVQPLGAKGGDPAGVTAGEHGSVVPGNDLAGSAPRSVATTDAAPTLADATRGQAAVETQHIQVDTSSVGTTTSGTHGQAEQGSVTDAVRRPTSAETSSVSSTAHSAHLQGRAEESADATRHTGATVVTSTTVGVQSKSHSSASESDRRVGSIGGVTHGSASPESQPSVGVASKSSTDSGSPHLPNSASSSAENGGERSNGAARRNQSQESRASGVVVSASHVEHSPTRERSSSLTSRDASKETSKEPTVGVHRSSGTSQASADQVALLREGNSTHRAAPAVAATDTKPMAQLATGGFRPQIPNRSAASERKVVEAVRKELSKAKPKLKKGQLDQDKTAESNKKGGKTKNQAGKQKNDSKPSRPEGDERGSKSHTLSPDDEVAAFRDRDSGDSGLFGQGDDDVA